MPSHKSEDYKIIAVKYHLENNSSFVNTCKIFKCNERSLKRWIDKYNNQHTPEGDLKSYIFGKAKNV